LRGCRRYGKHRRDLYASRAARSRKSLP